MSAVQGLSNAMDLWQVTNGDKDFHHTVLYDFAGNCEDSVNGCFFGNFLLDEKGLHH